MFNTLQKKITHLKLKNEDWMEQTSGNVAETNDEESADRQVFHKCDMYIAYCRIA